MALIFLNRYFYPDHAATSQILADLAFSLARQGRPITIITSRQRYDAPTVLLPARETIDGVNVIRLSTTRFGRNRLLGRAIDYISFYCAAAWTLWRMTRRGDVIIAMTDPPMLSIIAAPIVKLRQAVHVNWLQDIFPEIAEALGLAKGWPARQGLSFFRRLRDPSLGSADINVVLGARMADHLASSGVRRDRICIIPNWADGSRIRPVPHIENPLRREWGLEDAFVVGYSGNLGRAHEVETIVGAIAALEQQRADAAALGLPQLLWLFIGGGAQLESLKREIERRGLTSVRFQPYQPRESLANSLSAADIHLVSLRPELEGLVVPSKFYGIAAAGRPAVFIGDPQGEIATTLSLNACGVTVPMGDCFGLAKTVTELAVNPEMCRAMGERARAALMDNYDLSIGVRKWAALLDNQLQAVAGSS